MGKPPKRNKKQGTQRGHVYRKVQSPFQGMTETEAFSMIKEMGVDAKKDFGERFTSLMNHVVLMNPFMLLSSISVYGLTVLQGRDPELSLEKPILQHHVEVLQSLVLRHDLVDFEGQPTTHEYFEIFRDLVSQTQKSFALQRLSIVEVDMSPQERHKNMAMESMRGHTQAVRNWGYPRQVRTLLRGLFSPLTDALNDKVGLRFDPLIDMLYGVVTIIERRIAEHFSLLRPVAKAKSIEHALALYREAFDVPDELLESLAVHIRQERLALAQVQSVIQAHSDLWLPKIHMVGLLDFVAAYPEPVDSDRLKTVLDGWSLGFGDLKTETPDHFFLSNPVWTKPLVRVEDGLYFLAIPGLIHSFGLELLESVVERFPDVLAKYEKRRGDYLEEELEKLFRLSFPTATICRGSQWTDQETKRQYESDLVVVLDSCLLLVEAKAAKITDLARRGHIQRLQRTLKDLFVAPSVQSWRFAEFLRQQPGVHRFSTKSGKHNTLDTSAVRHLIRLSVTLDFIGPIATKWPDLREAGLIPPDVQMAPTMALTDLQILFDVLEGESQKLHYLMRRTEFEKNAHYLGDEIDLLGFYLDNGFNVGEVEFNGGGLLLTGASKRLDPYFMQEEYGVSAPKPRRRLSKLWRDILKKLEDRKPQGWTDIGLILHNVEYQAQEEFGQGLEQVKRNVKLRWGRPHCNSVMSLQSGPPKRRDAIIAVAFRDLSRDDRNKRLTHEAAVTANAAECARVVVIGIDVGDHVHPYNVIGYVEPRSFPTTSESE